MEVVAATTTNILYMQHTTRRWLTLSSGYNLTPSIQHGSAIQYHNPGNAHQDSVTSWHSSSQAALYTDMAQRTFPFTGRFWPPHKKATKDRLPQQHCLSPTKPCKSCRTKSTKTSQKIASHLNPASHITALAMFHIFIFFNLLPRTQQRSVLDLHFLAPGRASSPCSLPAIHTTPPRQHRHLGRQFAQQISTRSRNNSHPIRPRTYQNRQ